MFTVCFLTSGGTRKWMEAPRLLMFGSLMAIGLVLGGAVLVEAGEDATSAANLTADVQIPSEPTELLDRQLAAVESRIQRLQREQAFDTSERDGQVVQHDSQLMATRMEPDSLSHLAQDEANPSEVQRLDETLVQDTYLDPFSDDTNTEVIKDPWEPMNAKVFSFNMNVDRYVLKPVATGYAWVVPDPIEQAIGRAIYNIRFVPRTVNDLLQWKWENAGVEVGRFLVNSTVGVAGLFDVAGDYLDLQAVPAEDFGQTLAMHGVQAGPYLVLPFLPPTTVRDGIGTVGDVFLDPLSYVLPFVPQASVRATEIVNERSQNLDLYEGVEVATLDMYGAVREAYAQKRSKAIWE